MSNHSPTAVAMRDEILDVIRKHPYSIGLIDDAIDRHLAERDKETAEVLVEAHVTKTMNMDAPFDGGPDYEFDILITANDLATARQQAQDSLAAALKAAREGEK